MMTIDKEIAHLKEMVEKNKKEVQWCKENPKAWNDGGIRKKKCKKRAKKHKRLVEWLEELKEYRKIGTIEEFEYYKKMIQFTDVNSCRMGMMCVPTLKDIDSVNKKMEWCPLKPMSEKEIPKKMFIGNDNGKPRKCCSSCGCFVLPASRYCSKCGQKIDRED